MFFNPIWPWIEFLQKMFKKSKSYHWPVPKACPKCKTIEKYSEKYDAGYCDKCNEWREKACKSPACDYCAERPERPL